MNLTTASAPHWTVSVQPGGPLLTATARTLECELVLLGVPSSYSPSEVEGWLRDLIGVARETARADVGERPLPVLLHHALTGLLFSHAQLWDRPEAPPPCSLAFVHSGAEAGFGWVGSAVPEVWIDGRPVEPQWTRVRDEEGREAFALSLDRTRRIDVRLRWPVERDSDACVVDAAWNEQLGEQPTTAVGAHPAGLRDPGEPAAAPPEALSVEPVGGFAGEPRDAAGEPGRSVDERPWAGLPPSVGEVLEALSVEPMSGRPPRTARPGPPVFEAPPAWRAPSALEPAPPQQMEPMLEPVLEAAPEPASGAGAPEPAHVPPPVEAVAPPEAGAPGWMVVHESTAAPPGSQVPRAERRRGFFGWVGGLFARRRGSEVPEVPAADPGASQGVPEPARVEPLWPAVEPPVVQSPPPEAHEPVPSIVPPVQATPTPARPAEPPADWKSTLESLSSLGLRTSEPRPAQVPPPTFAPPEPPAAFEPAPPASGIPRLPLDPPVARQDPAPAPPRVEIPRLPLEPPVTRQDPAPAPPRVEIPGLPLDPPVAREDPAPAAAPLPPAVDWLPPEAAVVDEPLRLEPVTPLPEPAAPAAPSFRAHASPVTPEPVGPGPALEPEDVPSGTWPVRPPLRPEWPELAAPKARPRWRVPWLWIAGFFALFMGGWLVGGLQFEPDRTRPNPLTRALRAVGIGGTVYEVTVQSEPTGAWIAVDGKDLARRTPATLELAPGERQVTLSFSDLGSATYTVRGERGDRVMLDAALWGGLSIRASDASIPIQVSVDGQARGFVPVALDSLVPGAHELRFSGPGLAPWGQTVQVRIGEVHEVLARPMTSPATGLIEVRATLADERGVEPLNGATVWVDGVKRGVTPLTLELPRGPHSLRVDHQGVTAPVQVIDLPGGNQRFATFELGLGPDRPTLDPLVTPARVPIDRPTVLSGSLAGVSANDVREMWLHVRTPEDTWRRYPMTLLKATGGVVGVAVYPPTMFDGGGEGRWYMSASTQSGDELFTEIHDVSSAPPVRSGAPLR